MDLNSFIGDGNKQEQTESVVQKTKLAPAPKASGQVKIQSEPAPLKKRVESPKPWIVTHLPQDTSGIVGREEQITKLKKYVSNFTTAKKKGFFFCGPAGSGKTSCAHALAKELDYELFEINASDARGKDKLQALLAPATKQKSFFYKGKIILVDEVDGLSGTKDRGGIPELAKIIEESAVPIVLTANIIDTQKFKPLLKVVEMVEMNELDPKIIAQILTGIIKKENVEKTPQADEAIELLSKNCDGDARAAINDLQMLVVENKIDPDRLEMVSERKRTQSIESVLKTIFKGDDAQASYEGAMQLAENFDTQMLWIEYNVGKEYKHPFDLARAYGALAKADVFRARIRKNQEWRFILYAQILATSGVTVAKSKVYDSPPFYQQTSRLLRIWQINMSNAKRKTIAQKIADSTHCSARDAFSQVDYYRVMFSHKHDMKHTIASELALDDGEIAWLSK